TLEQHDAVERSEVVEIEWSKVDHERTDLAEPVQLSKPWIGAWTVELPIADGSPSGGRARQHRLHRVVDRRRQGMHDDVAVVLVGPGTCFALEAEESPGLVTGPERRR